MLSKRWRTWAACFRGRSTASSWRNGSRIVSDVVRSRFVGRLRRDVGDRLTTVATSGDSGVPGTTVVEAFAGLGALALENAPARAGAGGQPRQGRLLAAISRELRTPLTAIAGWVGVLRARGGMPDVVRRAVAALERSNQAQKAIVDEPLDVSKITTRPTPVEAGPPLRRPPRAPFGA